MNSIPVYRFDASKSRFGYAINDILGGFARPRLLMTLTRTSFLNRYQGTFFGGFWITFSTAIMVIGLGLLWGQVFGVPLDLYFPYITVGIIAWGVISTAINDSVSVFILGGAIYNQMPVPKTIFILRSLGLQLISLFYKFAVVVGIFIYTGWAVDLNGVLMSFAGLGLVLFSGYWFSLLIGPIGLRFRDVGQLVSTLLTFAFFLTPVIWQVDRLGEYRYLVNFNPLYHYLNAIRGPLIGQDDAYFSFLVAAGVSGALMVLGLITFGLFARRMSYWS